MKKQTGPRCFGVKRSGKTVKRILIKGAGDLATGTAVRLYRAGFPLVMTDIEQPTAVRRTVAFCQCMYDGVCTVEGITARRVYSGVEALAAMEKGEIPVLNDPEAKILKELDFFAVVDAILAKRNIGTTIHDAPVVLALGPGFTAGVDCHGVIETQRGHDLGRLITDGSAVPNTGVPGDIGGYTTERIIRACADGTFEPVAAIGDQVQKGDLVAKVDGQPVYALINGVVRGMLPAGLKVFKGMKSGDIDPRCQVRHCFTVSDKARAIGGGVLEGLLYFGKEKGLWND
ncbi:selenium-dependent molybdenum hydroxylase system protein, YqeB family [Pseudoflavonifractor capillosus ATCC 29799]|uniref:Selenium-dependent molybdenum hydroxylase system protein, YqeB family n=1 Tax=Pseudoflavonifractor capillosus ATCC 29799 TaxID=411467 RepID=A6NQ82_9FIRM|nr:selenium-dependent molybdenum hydroxylase system protein, YqeB family [Pseudoflavonifractor capillosus ATCC 29799]